MDGFIDFFTRLIVEAGIPKECIFTDRTLEIPGFFRPTKEWDLLVVRDGRLLAAIETKSQVGPSFGNNFNNRTEEAIGSAVDVWTAFRENAFGQSVAPFLGYFFMLEDCEATRRAVKVNEPHFPVFPDFKGASYARRYELLCRRLVLERHYTAATFIVSDAQSGINGAFRTPATDLSAEGFAHTLRCHLGVHP